MTDLHAILERVEAASGSDRELDGDIAEMFNIDRLKPEYVRGQARSFTSSLDAAVALVEAKLPGCSWEISNGPAQARIWGADFCDERLDLYWESGSGRTTPTLALIAALLHAMIASAKDKP